MIGETLSNFQITAKLGEGGMGEVYRATDTRLGREVAIKVLPEAVADDPERLARFEREAKVLASLDHGNIAAIYGLEEAAGQRLLVMQLVDGEDLSARIGRGRLEPDEAVAIALQIAHALESAHEKGIVHRDLKPANVMLGADGSVKVLDFGLAKALEEETGDGSAPGLTQSPTLTAQMTQAGVLLGTAGYMSPEQARGQEADKRSDIWAFGVVLMEMLTGETVYKGDTVSDTLASVLAREPEWESLPEDTPVYLRRLLDRCLEKDVKNRLRDIGEARIILESPEPDPQPAAETGAVAVDAPPPKASLLPWAVALGAVALAAALGLLLARSPEPQRPPTTRLTAVLPVGQELAAEYGGSVAFSPDGRSLAYVTRSGEETSLFIRDLGNLEGREITDAAGARQPFFSPDGKWIGYFTNSQLRKVAVTGGASFTLAKADTSRGGSWGPDDMIYFAPTVTSEIQRVSAAGGESETVTERSEKTRSHRWPQLLADGRHLIYTSQPEGSNFNEASIELKDLESGTVTVLHRGGSTARLLPSGHLVFVREGTLFAAPLDLGARRLTAQPAPVATGLLFDQGSGAVHLTTSSDGTLLYVTGQSAIQQVSPALVGRDGRETLLTPEIRNYRNPRFSPDGSRVAFDFDTEGNERDIWIYDLERKVFSRITFHEDNDRFPVWLPDGTRIAFMNARTGEPGVYVRAADGSGEDEIWVEGSDEDGAYMPASFTPDGRFLAMDKWDSGDDGWDLAIFDTESREVTVYLATEFNERRPAISPSGNWIAYQSDESGRYEVYVRPFPDTGGRWQVSVEGGRYPRWSPSGEEILFRSSAGIEGARVVDEGSALRMSRPEMLLAGSETELAMHTFFPMFDVSRDGQSLLIFRDDKTGETTPPQLQAVFHWFDELDELVPLAD
jgi:serine/threonine-protein kinase